MRAAAHRFQDLAHLTLSDASIGIRSGAFTSEALTARYAERILEHDHRIRAWAWFDESRAIAEARKADQGIREGAVPGPLHGIPIGVKDIIYTKGLPTRLGSSIFADFVPGHSATCVEKLLLAGGFVQGKTVTTEFANQYPGPTTNPWDTRFTPGGSSSGSAAAVAAGFTTAALGSQTRGSTIRPAVYCGVVGFKPSFGLISRHGVHRLSSTLDHVGVFTRSIDDAGFLVSCLMGEDPLDLATLARAQLPPALHKPGELPHPPRVAALRSTPWSTADDAQQQLFDANCAKLRKMGAKVEAVELAELFHQANEVASVILRSEVAHNFGTLRSESGARMSPKFRELCDRGLRYPAVEYLAALDARTAMRKALAALFQAFDAIVTPPATGEAPRTLNSTGDAGFCTLWTLCGVPSVGFPTGTGPNGLPMGLQVVGALFEDTRTLQIAKWCMRCLPFTKRLDF